MSAPTAPPRWKLFVLTFVGIYPPLLGVLFFGLPHLLHLPFALRTALVAGVLVFLMVFFIMPFLTRTFAAWLRR